MNISKLGLPSNYFGGLGTSEEKIHQKLFNNSGMNQDKPSYRRWRDYHNRF